MIYLPINFTLNSMKITRFSSMFQTLKKELFKQFHSCTDRFLNQNLEKIPGLPDIFLKKYFFLFSPRENDYSRKGTLR